MEEGIKVDFWRYLGLLRRWLWLLILVAVLGGVTGYIVSRLQTPIYQSSTTLLINEAPGSKSAIDYNSLLTSQRLASTYVQLLTERSVLEKVIPLLPYTTTVEQLKVKISASVVRDTNLIQVNVTDPNPATAALIANSLATAFSNQVEETQAARYQASEDSLQVQMKRVDEQIQQTRADIQALGTDAANKDQRDRLQANLVQYQTSYNTYSQSYEQIRFTAAQNNSNVTQVETAIPVFTPISPRVATNTALAGVVGLLLALGAVLLFESLDDTLRHTGQITNESGLPVLGFIPFFTVEEGQRLPVVAVSPRSPIAERFRALRTNIQFTSPDHPLHTLLITSPGPGDGKSTVASNLAVAVSQGGRRVTMVDGDMRRPTLHKRLNVENQGGLSALFIQPNLYLNGNLQSTGMPGLNVLTGGNVPPNPAELLGSAKMLDILRAVKDETEMVIIDSPPVTSVTDAVVLAPGVDGVLIVVRPGVTKLAAAREAINELKRAGANILGLIVNGVRAEDIRYYSGYYHYYYYYHYYEEDRPLTTTQRWGKAIGKALGLKRRTKSRRQPTTPGTPAPINMSAWGQQESGGEEEKGSGGA